MNVFRNIGVQRKTLGVRHTTCQPDWAGRQCQAEWDLGRVRNTYTSIIKIMINKFGGNRLIFYIHAVYVALFIQ